MLYVAVLIVIFRQATMDDNSQEIEDLRALLEKASLATL
jgi:hypothetical protein